MVRYRPAIKIVLRILECIATRQSSGRALKTHIIQCANLKTTSAEKYLEMLKEAGYILEKRENWGERVVIVYELTPLGKERYNWFGSVESYGGGLVKTTSIDSSKRSNTIGCNRTAFWPLKIWFRLTLPISR